MNTETNEEMSLLQNNSNIVYSYDWLTTNVEFNRFLHRNNLNKINLVYTGIKSYWTIWGPKKAHYFTHGQDMVDRQKYREYLESFVGDLSSCKTVDYNISQGYIEYMYNNLYFIKAINQFLKEYYPLDNLPFKIVDCTTDLYSSFGVSKNMYNALLKRSYSEK